MTEQSKIALSDKKYLRGGIPQAVSKELAEKKGLKVGSKCMVRRCTDSGRLSKRGNGDSVLCVGLYKFGFLTENKMGFKEFFKYNQLFTTEDDIVSIL